jgi:glycosyltransferase involved in cell wall biosynthesis
VSAARATGCRSVLLCTEGTYPYVGGGVSTWCDILCRELGEYEFITYAITGCPEVTLRFELPANARSVLHIPLWGVTEPAEHVLRDVPAAVIRRRRRATTPGVVAAEFVPLLRELLAGMFRAGTPQPRAADPVARAGSRIVWRMWRYFQARDWSATWRAQATWDAFVAGVLCAYAGPGEDGSAVPSVGELATALHWLVPYLTPLAAPIPMVDLVHVTIAGFPGLPGVIAKRERGTPVLVTEHGVWVRERYIAISSGPYSLFAKRFLMDLSRYVARLAYAAADVVAPVTNYNRRWEVPSGVEEERIETIFNGIDPRLFVPRPKPAETAGRPVVVAAARVFPLKDIETMIRAAALVREELADVEFRLYGSLDADPPYVERCRALIAELELEGTFRFAGHHPNPAELFCEGDVSALSSISEGFPYTVIESMACARPVVATDVGGVREAVEGFGLVVPPRDHAAFARALVLLLRDHELRGELGRQAREAVLARFRTHHSVDAYRALYTRLIDTGEEIAA